MRTLYSQKGSEFRIEVLAEPKVQEFINAHAGALDSTFKQVEMSDSMRRRLTRSNYIFSGMKTFHELNEAFPSIVDENGERKSFERFLNDVRRIDKTYNSNYLRAEYNFVVSSATMAAKWEEFMEDSDRYNLQYRTAKDDKVRPEHAALDGVTQPPSDSFWAEYYPLTAGTAVARWFRFASLSIRRHLTMMPWLSERRLCNATQRASSISIQERSRSRYQIIIHIRLGGAKTAMQ